MTAESETRFLPIARWHQLAQQGTVIPMCIPLDGDSMRPLIRRGKDCVTITPLTRSLMVGDVVLFEAPPGRYVVHRVYRLEPKRVQTLGDHCVRPDPWMPLACVLGQAVQVRRGWLTLPLDTSAARLWGRLWMALLPLRQLYMLLRRTAGRLLRRLGLRKGGERT